MRAICTPAAATAALRVNGRVTTLDVPPLGAGALDAFLESVLQPDAARRWRETRSADVALWDGVGAPYRLHAYTTMSGLRFAFRFLSSEVRGLDTLGVTTDRERSGSPNQRPHHLHRTDR